MLRCQEARYDEAHQAAVHCLQLSEKEGDLALQKRAHFTKAQAQLGLHEAPAVVVFASTALMLNDQHVKESGVEYEETLNEFAHQVSAAA
jgi:hypothetical protein